MHGVKEQFQNVMAKSSQMSTPDPLKLFLSLFLSASYRQNGSSMVVHSFMNSMEPPGSAEMSQMASSRWGREGAPAGETLVIKALSSFLQTENRDSFKDSRAKGNRSDHSSRKVFFSLDDSVEDEGGKEMKDKTTMTVKILHFPGTMMKCGKGQSSNCRKRKTGLDSTTDKDEEDKKATTTTGQMRSFLT